MGRSNDLITIEEATMRSGLYLAAPTKALAEDLGGDPAHTVISTVPLTEDMCHESPAEEDILTIEELTELLAEVTDTTPEEIERGAAEIEIAPPEEGEVVKTFGDAGPLDA